MASVRSRDGSLPTIHLSMILSSALLKIAFSPVSCFSRSIASAVILATGAAAVRFACVGSVISPSPSAQALSCGRRLQPLLDQAADARISSAGRDLQETIECPHHRGCGKIALKLHCLSQKDRPKPSMRSRDL